MRNTIVIGEDLSRCMTHGETFPESVGYCQQCVEEERAAEVEAIEAPLRDRIAQLERELEEVNLAVEARLSDIHTLTDSLRLEKEARERAEASLAESQFCLEASTASLLRESQLKRDLTETRAKLEAAGHEISGLGRTLQRHSDALAESRLAHAETKRLAEAIIAALPKCDRDGCERPQTKGKERASYLRPAGRYGWCDQCAKDHYVIYPGTNQENLYPSPGAKVPDMPIAAPLRAWFAAHPGEKKEGACNCVVIGQHVDFSDCDVHRLERAEQSAPGEKKG
jgi:hypothetical protein